MLSDQYSSHCKFIKKIDIYILSVLIDGLSLWAITYIFYILQITKVIDEKCHKNSHLAIGCDEILTNLNRFAMCVSTLTTSPPAVHFVSCLLLFIIIIPNCFLNISSLEHTCPDFFYRRMRTSKGCTVRLSLHGEELNRLAFRTGKMG